MFWWGSVVGDSVHAHVEGGEGEHGEGCQHGILYGDRRISFLGASHLSG